MWLLWENFYKKVGKIDILLDDGSVKTRIVEGSAIVTAGVTTG